MDTISSADFRKTYAKLTEPTIVTVNGHVIGEWTPLRYTTTEDVEDVRKVGATAGHDSAEVAQALRAFNSRPFTAVPKTRGR